MPSIWTETCPMRAREPLGEDIKADAAVIGAGMAGVLIANALQEGGMKVAVLEADRVGGGQTRNTTAKVTAQHGLIYSRLIRTLGVDRARQYAQANQTAVAALRGLAAGIDCDWEDRSAYLYGGDRTVLRREAEAARSLGLPADYTDTVPLPFYASSGVRLAGQGQFHPLKFLRAIADRLTIYERTPVWAVEGNVLAAGRRHVQAELVIFACHYPFVNFPGLYFTRMHQERSYVLALEGAGRLDGIFYGLGPEGVSLRTFGDLVLLGGESHRTGENRRGGRYEALLDRARTLFPGCRVRARWSAQDCVTPDGVPYIGRFSQSRPNWYVATGFQKWGMTHSMVSALLLRDLTAGRANPWESVFDPGRFGSAGLAGVLREGGHSVKGLSKTLFHVPGCAVEALPPGEGGVVFLGDRRAGAYKTLDGTVYAVDLTCPHLGCQLEWNPDEKTWDCPCHGSRFDFRGKLLSGPAQSNLKRL